MRPTNQTEHKRLGLWPWGKGRLVRRQTEGVDGGHGGAPPEPCGKKREGGARSKDLLCLPKVRSGIGLFEFVKLLGRAFVPLGGGGLSCSDTAR